VLSNFIAPKNSILTATYGALQILYDDDDDDDQDQCFTAKSSWQ